MKGIDQRSLDLLLRKVALAPVGATIIIELQNDAEWNSGHGPAGSADPQGWDGPDMLTFRKGERTVVGFSIKNQDYQRKLGGDRIGLAREISEEGKGLDGFFYIRREAIYSVRVIE
ncbi:hypothetical protein ACFL2V_14740 [Pseudomonadota bacterium]